MGAVGGGREKDSALGLDLLAPHPFSQPLDQKGCVETLTVFAERGTINTTQTLFGRGPPLSFRSHLQTKNNALSHHQWGMGGRDEVGQRWAQEGLELCAGGWNSGVACGLQRGGEGCRKELKTSRVIARPGPSCALSSPWSHPLPQVQSFPEPTLDPKFDVAAACTFQVAPQRLRLPDFCLQLLGPFPLPSPTRPHRLPHPLLATKTPLPPPAL